MNLQWQIGEKTNLYESGRTATTKVKYLKILQNGNNKKVKYPQNFTNNKKQLNSPNIIFCGIH